eukprot:gene20433-26515_t
MADRVRFILDGLAPLFKLLQIKDIFNESAGLEVFTLADLNSLDKNEVSKSLFGQIHWEELLRSGIFLQPRDHQLLERAQANLSVILDNEQDSKDLIAILLKIANQSFPNVVIHQYTFTRIEEILGLTVDYENDTESYGNPTPLVEWIANKLTTTAPGIWEMALEPLTILLRNSKARDIFVSSSGISYIITQLKKIGANGNAQHIYELIFSLWTISLNANNNIESFLHAGAIPTLVDFIATSPSRKVTRVSIAALKNLAIVNNDDALTEMFASNLEKVLENLFQSAICKNSTDIEFDSDIKSLNDILLKNYRDLSTYDRWFSEVHSGSLRWGVVHTEKFWRENVKHIEQNEFKALRLLIDRLNSSDPVEVSIALYDLGEFARFYPNGRVVVSRLGGKDLAMQKMNHDDPEIRRYALQCVSKIMVSNWEHMK